MDSKKTGKARQPTAPARKHPKTLLERCHHCGNRVPLAVLHGHVRDDYVDFPSGTQGPFEEITFLVKCPTCDDVSLVGTHELLEESYILYPVEKKLADSVPQPIRDLHNQARSVLKTSPTAYALLIRKALDYLCEDKGVTGSNLAEKIAGLASHGIAPGNLASMASGVRILGNIGAHELTTVLEDEDVALMEDFFRAIIEYVYIGPQKIRVFQERLAALKRTKPKPPPAAGSGPPA